MEAGLSQGPLPDWDFWMQGLDRMFFAQTYKKSLIVGTVAALALMAFEQRTWALGLVSGLGIAIFSSWTAEVTVKLLFNGGKGPGLRLAIAAMVKMPFLVAMLLAVAWASYHKYMNIFAVVAGVLVLHGTMLVSIIATSVANLERNRERYR